MRLPDPAQPLDGDAAQAAFAAILSGDVADADIAAFLVALADRGETVGEIVAAARVLRSHAATIAAPDGAIDVCGTGGDGSHSVNVSTAVAIVVAACGVPVAKHGNRAASSRAGAADVLTALGLDVAAPFERAERSLAELGIAFLFAARHHAAMGRVAAVRREIGRRTIFNLLGPLANPAGVRRQLVGVFSDQWVQPVARALAELGSIREMVVHGRDGLDELTVTTGSLTADRATASEVTPETAGLVRHPADALRGGSPEENAESLRRLLAGQQGAYRDIVLLNASAALQVAGRTADWREGAGMAANAIDDGAAADLLARWVAFR